MKENLFMVGQCSPVVLE